MNTNLYRLGLVLL